MQRSVVIGIVAAAAILVAGGVAAWFLIRAPSAQAVAEDYLRGLSEGDFASIEGVLAERGEDVDLAGTAFAGADSYISDYSFDIEDGASAALSVHADVTLAGLPAVVGFGLVQEGGRWKVGADYLAEVTIQTSIGDSVRVGGTLIPAGVPVSLLPAAYPVTAAPAGLVMGESTAVVTNASPVTVSVDATVSPDAVAAAQEQLDVYADACAQPADAVPENCGLRIPWGADLAALSSIDFRIAAYPVVTIADDGSGFAATGGDIVATAAGTTREGVPGTFTYRADDWALRGAIAFKGDEMILAVR